MNKYKITHFHHLRAVLEHFLKVSKARLYKLFKFARSGAGTQDDNEILEREFLVSDLLERLRIVVSSRVKGQ